MPAFVPPFLRKAKTETHKDAVLKDNIRAPSAFVPPFKKQKTFAEESSSKPLEKVDKHHHLFVMPSISNTYELTTKKKQSCADKSKEDIQMEALTDTKNDYLMKSIEHGLKNTGAY